jgi:hypothetical protein
MKSDVIIKSVKVNWRIAACLVVVAVLATLIVVRFGKYLAELPGVRNAVAAALAQSEKDPNDAKPSVDAAKNVANTLKKSNLFVKTPPKEHPIKQVDGILGNEVLIQDKWYKAGDKVGDAKIISVSATKILVEWDGKSKTFSPMASSAPEAGPSRPEPPKAKAVEPNKPAKKADANEVKAAAPQTDDPFAFMGVNLSPKLRAMLLQKWNSMTDEQKEQAKQQWNQMPEEQKQQMVQAIESMPEEQVQQAMQSMANR